MKLKLPIIFLERRNKAKYNYVNRLNQNINQKPMLKNITLEELAEFTQNESQILAELGLCTKDEVIETPSQHVVDNVLNYSKALSIRKSKIVGTIESVLN